MADIDDEKQDSQQEEKLEQSQAPNSGSIGQDATAGEDGSGVSSPSNAAETTRDQEQTSLGSTEIDTSFSDESSSENEEEILDELDRIAAKQHDGVVISKGLSIDPNKEKTNVLTIIVNFIKSISPETKKKSYVILGILSFTSFLVYLLLQGKLLPKFTFPYKVSYKEIAQEVYSYPTDGLEVPLFDDSRSKAFTVALPKATINLRSNGDDPDYGEFEFFLNLRDRDLVARVNSQQSDIMEIVRRSLETVSWNELQTPLGKDRIKKQIRAEVNKYLNGNMVLSVYYRSVILSR